MGRLWQRAVEHAGLSELAQRALAGAGLSPADIAHLRTQDLLIVAGLADAVRARHRGDEVRVFGHDAVRREPMLVRPSLDAGRADGPTGHEVLFEIALTRLATPCEYGLCVSFEQLGLELAQTALAFGADALTGDLGSKRTLPLLEGAAARRVELQGLIERAGRSVRFVEAQPVALESRS